MDDTQSPRKRDEEILSDPVDMEKWIAPQDYESLLELCDHNLIQSQLLFGTEVIVVRRDGSWSEVVVAEQPSSKVQTDIQDGFELSAEQG